MLPKGNEIVYKVAAVSVGLKNSRDMVRSLCSLRHFVGNLKTIVASHAKGIRGSSAAFAGVDVRGINSCL